ncbi:MAG: histidinol-phosphate transaminase [Planctomycetes bacterium]|nr:histidinol-phosphate transaminase [Planctomycetota bacterium]
MAGIRANILSMAGYAPGEQPREDGIIKLNTNENPYPPSPRVVEAIRAALTGDRLRKYPEPLGHTFRKQASQVLGIDPDSVLIGNGSDDLLTIVTRAFVPEGGLIVSPTPSYILYRSLAEIQGARFEAVPFTPTWELPDPWPIRDAHLTFLPNPNSPSGTCISHSAIQRLAAQIDGPLILDEAYADFADTNGLSLAGKLIIVTRTLSKSYALAGIRFGFAVADPSVIRELEKVKDSYNCDVLSLAAAGAALEDQEYLNSTRARILATRARLATSLVGLGFQVTPSQANFVWCQRTDRPLKPIFEELKKRRILIRYMNYANYGDGLRISVGSDAEIDQLLRELANILS